MNFQRLRKANVERCEKAFRHSIDDWSPERWSNAMAGECGEVCNAVKKLNRIEDGTNTAKDPATENEAVHDISMELADLIIYADLLAERLGINLGFAIREKFNIVSDRMHSDVYL